MKVFNHLLAASVLNYTQALPLNVNDDSFVNMLTELVEDELCKELSSLDYTPKSICEVDDLPDEDDKCFRRSAEWCGPVSK